MEPPGQTTKFAQVNEVRLFPGAHVDTRMYDHDSMKTSRVNINIFIYLAGYAIVGPVKL